MGRNSEDEAVMTSDDLKNKLIDLLQKGCLEHLEHLKKDLSEEEVFSYTIYCSSGCRNMGIAACTQQWLKSNVGSEENFAEVNAAEWDYVNQHYQLFDEVDEFIDDLYEIFYEGELGDVDLDSFDDTQLWNFMSGFFVDVVSQVLTALKDLGKLQGRPFVADLLLGLQFGDPDHYAVEMIEKVSEAFNSKEWHKKVLLNCEQIRSNFDTTPEKLSTC